ncbi:type II toxin-antitoxin system HigB family toxin [Aequorivita sp. H23M31]|uniref:Type II toxin-antitoxin system HigB family toxin n=1 Tax=Aequorivita ciconiae TaxID=2494375 RepID=A0A410G7B0_9FLAO|nr:type II toxin-antitoxin system HigB family toxin [Aequorivita sp. H23M31]
MFDTFGRKPKLYPPQLSENILKDHRIVFNIKGNDYRLTDKFNFEYQLAWKRFIGTYGEPARPAGGYDKINANEI